MTPAWASLPSVADRVLSRRQGLKLDLTEDAWQWQLDRQLWTPMAPGVVALHSGEPTRRQLDWGGLLRIGDDAVLAGDSVLLAHGFPFKELGYVDVVTTRRVRTRHRLTNGQLVRVHTLNDLEGLKAVTDGMPVMSLPASVVYGAEWASTARAAEWRLATSVQRGLVAVEGLRAAVQAAPELSRAALLQTALDDVEHGAHAMSELDLLKVCREHDLPEPDEMQVLARVVSGKRFLDFRYKKPRVRGEVDGAHHRYVETWEADLLRGNDLALATRDSDEVQLRWTGTQVRHQGWLVARQLRAALRL